MRRNVFVVCGVSLLLIAGYLAANRHATVVHAQTEAPAAIPKSYGRLVTAIADQIGTGLVFEDAEGVVRFVSVTGMKEGELARYDTKPVHGGIPKSYGHLVTAVVNTNGMTGLIFEDDKGVIRFVTLTGQTEQTLTRD